QNLTTLNSILVNAAQQAAHVVASLALVQKLPEHLDARHNRLLRLAKADDLNLVANLDHTALNTARHNRATPRNREHVLDRHQERLVLRTLRLRDVRVQSLHQLQDRLVLWRALLAVQRLHRSTSDHRNAGARELVLRQRLTHLTRTQIHKLGIVNYVA